MSDKEKTGVEAHLAHLRDCVWDLPSELLYYGRKRAEEGPTPEEVRALQRDGHLTIEMLTQWFAEALKEDWPQGPAVYGGPMDKPTKEICENCEFWGQSSGEFGVCLGPEPAERAARTDTCGSWKLKRAASATDKTPGS